MSLIVCLNITTFFIVILSLGCISLCFYLVGNHYPIVGWTKGEFTAFMILFIPGDILFLIIFIACCDYIFLYYRISTANGGGVEPELIELNEIIYPNKDFNFRHLKNEVLKLKSKELEPKLKTSQTQFTGLITQLQNRVDNDTKAIIDLYLQTHAQIIAQDKENDTFAQGQLTNFENVLQNNLTQEELQTLRALQKETLALEKHSNNLKHY